MMDGGMMLDVSLHMMLNMAMMVVTVKIVMVVAMSAMVSVSAGLGRVAGQRHQQGGGDHHRALDYILHRSGSSGIGLEKFGIGKTWPLLT
jgi:hypothetical protein